MEISERELVRLTGLWKRKGKNGVEYYAGVVSPTATLFLFPARDRRNGNKPEFIVYIGQTKSGEDPEDIIKEISPPLPGGVSPET